MRARIPIPRLLPTTIAFMAVLLAIKCGILVDGAVFRGPKSDGAMVTVARANEAGGQKPTSQATASAAKPQGISASSEIKAAVPTQLPTTSPSPSKEPEAAAVNDSEKVLLQDLRRRREELDAQSDTLKVREAVLGAAEQKLTTRVSELQALQHRLESLSAEQKQKEDAGWQGFAKMYEAMKPREAANIFNDLSMPVLLQVLDRMKDAKAALVMAAMNPDKARDVTAELARLRLGHDPAAPPDETRSPAAGG